MCSKELPQTKLALQREKKLRSDASARAEALAKKLTALQRKLAAISEASNKAEACQAKLDAQLQAKETAQKTHDNALQKAGADAEKARAALTAAMAKADQSQAEAIASNTKLVAMHADLSAVRAENTQLQAQVHAAQVALSASQATAVDDTGTDLAGQLERALRQRDDANVQLAHSKKEAALKQAECDALKEDFAAFRSSMAEFRSAATQAVSMHQDMAQAVARAAGAAKQMAAKEALVNMMRVCVVAPQVTLRLVQSRTVNHFAGGDAAAGRGASDTHITEEAVSVKAPLSAAMVNLQSTISKDIMPRFAKVYSKVMQAADAALSRTPYTVSGDGGGGGQGSEALFKAVSDADESKMLSDLCDRMAAAVRKIIAKEFDSDMEVHTNTVPGEMRG